VSAEDYEASTLLQMLVVMGLASKSMLHLTCYAKLKIVSDMQHSVYLFDEDTGQHSAYLRLSFSPVASF